MNGLGPVPPLGTGSVNVASPLSSVVLAAAGDRWIEAFLTGPPSVVRVTRTLMEMLWPMCAVDGPESARWTAALSMSMMGSLTFVTFQTCVSTSACA